MTDIPLHYADTDIDIDFQDRDQALSTLRHHRAVLIDDDHNYRPHNVGVYFQSIPHDPVTNLATISTDEATQRGYMKFDFLNVSLYDGVRDEAHLDKLIADEPIWELLLDQEIVSGLWQIHAHFEIVEAYAPKSVEEIAMLLAMIRPAKRHLLGEEWSTVRKTVWRPPQLGEPGWEHRGSFFKKSHSISYALGIVVQMNLIAEPFRD